MRQNLIKSHQNGMNKDAKKKKKKNQSKRNWVKKKKFMW